MTAVVDSGRTGHPERGLEFMANSYRMNWKFFQLGKPYVSIMDGLVSALRAPELR